MADNLFKRVVKLAHANPDLRPALLPIIKKYAEFPEDMTAEEIMAAKYKGRVWGDWAGGGGANNKDYKVPSALDNSNCYSDSNMEGKGTPGEGTCYRLHNEYGSGVSKNKAKYNKMYQEKWLNNDHKIKRKVSPDGFGGKKQNKKK